VAENQDNTGDRARSLIFLAGTVREVLGDPAEPPAAWETRLQELGRPDAPFRVAVAGTVKSGKSTLVNALIGRDVLKRGAGIVTSLVTRVRPGPGLKSRMRLKGWGDVNREATDAALFLGAGEDGRPVDLRSAGDRARLEGALAELGEEALGEGGFFDKNVALLRAYLQGQGQVAALLGEERREVEFGPEEFERHRDFAGQDALAAYVDDLVLEIPGLPFPGEWEIADCQGYDSPNPRHMEMVQEYLLGAHLVVYVVSSRVGLREADLRFLRDIKAMGLVESTEFVLNSDLAEHGSEEDLVLLRERMSGELANLAGPVPIHTFSALRALLAGLRARGQELSRKEELLLAIWAESPASASDDFPAFLDVIAEELGARRQARVAAAREAVVRRAAGALRSRVEAASVLAGKRAEALGEEQKALARARERVRASLAGFESALTGVSASLKVELFRNVDAAFHPAGGVLAAETLARVRALSPPPAALEAADRKRLLRQMARIYQEMRAAFHRYKVETVNPQAVDRIRALWAQASRGLAEAAGSSAEIVIQSVEAYRREAGTLGIELPPLDLPALDPAIAKTSIPLFSAVTYAPGQFAADRFLSFAGQWTRKLASGWAKRLVGKKDRTGFASSLLADGAEAVREILAEEARSNLLHYNEQVKYQVLGKSLDGLARAWTEVYRETVEALVLDLERLTRLVDRAESEREKLIPRLREVLRDLEPLVG
jgi:GTPase SAR1 family protein